MIRGGERQTTFSAQFPSVSPFACPPPSLRSLSTVTLRSTPLRPRPPSLNKFSLPRLAAASLFFASSFPSAIIFVGFETFRPSRPLPLLCPFPLRFSCAPGSTASFKDILRISLFRLLQALSCFFSVKTQTPFFIIARGGKDDKRLRQRTAPPRV